MELTEQESKDLHDYILLMLGSPVVKVELDETQIEFTIQESIKELELRVDPVDEKARRKFLALAKQGAYIRSKHILGRIRSKYDKSGPTEMKLDGKVLLAESKEELKEWKKFICNSYPQEINDAPKQP